MNTTDTTSNPSPSPIHPERNEAMKTENTETTAAEVVETIEEAPETTLTETAGVEATDDTAGTGEAPEQDAKEEDAEAEEELTEAEVEALGSIDRLFGENAPTQVSATPVSVWKKLIAIAGLLLVAVGVFGAVVLGHAAAQYADARWETDCINGQRYEARIASDFDGNLRAWRAAGHKVTELGTCDNISWQR